MKAKWFFSVVVVAAIAGGGLYYFQRADGKPAPTQNQASRATAIVLASPPREKADEGDELYKPIAEYLTKAIGKPVVYRRASTWGTYRTQMLNGEFDIIFDGGHFSDYRARMLNYNIVAKIPKMQEFAIIVRSDDKTSNVRGLVGQTMCTPPPPNQGALIMLSQFGDTPKEQPIIMPVTGNFWKAVFDNVASGRCKAGALVVGQLNKMNTKNEVRVLYKSKPQPNQAWSVGPRVSPEDRAKIAAALIAPAAAEPTEKLRTRFNVGEQFVAANNAEYAQAELAKLLRHEYGFEAIAKLD